jgi:hypothetical protein
MWATFPHSASSGYHAVFQEVCYQKHTNLRCRWPMWNKAAFVMDEKKLIIFVQGHEGLYNLQHRYYDNNLVKDSSWKEIAGELHAQDKELSRRTQHCRRMAGSWQGKGMVRIQAGTLLRFSHGHFLPNPFRFAFNQSSGPLTLFL